jgi:3-oxoacyl-[acyl-carrier-protein] synthase II
VSAHERLEGRRIPLADVAAAGLAVQDSGLDLSRENPERVGVVMGAGLVPIDLTEIAPLVADALDDDGQLHVDRLGHTGREALFPLWILKYLPNMAAAHIALIHGIQGPNSTIVTACTAGDGLHGWYTSGR